MTGKISGISSSQTPPVGAGSAGQRPPNMSGGAVQAAGGSPDSVQITGTASQLATLEQTLGGTPAVNESRVASVRNAIAQGSYPVSPQRIADQLLQLDEALPDYPEE